MLDLFTALLQLCNRMGACVHLERDESTASTVFWMAVPVVTVVPVPLKQHHPGTRSCASLDDFSTRT